MHNYPSTQILPTMEKSLGFFPFICTAIFPRKSFPTMGRSLSFSSPLNASSYIYPSPQILPHMGKDLSFLPPSMWLSLTRRGRSQTVFLEVHILLPASPQNVTFPPYPSPQTLSHLYVGRILPPSKCKNPTNPSLRFSIFYFIYLHYCFEFSLFVP